MHSLHSALRILAQDNLGAGLEGIGSLGKGSANGLIIRLCLGCIPGIRRLIALILIELIPGGAIMLQSCTNALSQWDHGVSHQSPFQQRFARLGGGMHLPVHDLIQRQ